MSQKDRPEFPGFSQPPPFRFLTRDEQIAKFEETGNPMWLPHDLRAAHILPSSSQRKKKRIPAHLRRAVMERDMYRCRSCGTHLDLSVDHIIPESKGGPTTLDNLQCLCQPCNSRKGER